MQRHPWLLTWVASASGNTALKLAERGLSERVDSMKLSIKGVELMKFYHEVDARKPSKGNNL
jgi:hypothetical protein